jgi:hypothetical protein
MAKNQEVPFLRPGHVDLTEVASRIYNRLPAVEQMALGSFYQILRFVHSPKLGRTMDERRAAYLGVYNQDVSKGFPVGKLRRLLEDEGKLPKATRKRAFHSRRVISEAQLLLTAVA